MPEQLAPIYLIAAVAVAGLITLGLRALPFAVLKPLRRSRFVQALGRWMPAGILLILAVVVLRDQFVSSGRIWPVAIATAVTIAVHLLGGRRALLSIAAGTACYILLINFI
ncbi:branched-chain amino acid transporter permease [Leucobacter ruminantium]|uniref:AzlD domain-containing protein n=1 Tax=Leucobacter ruminantium TaxID=1289170 RepID=A0A939LT29_9MICO|nr:AzlD domain-containing protein [Leucobacter ruminantium]MBO1803831.1 AzlD domain-containing protein [Leucobacter ruminantium]